MPCPPRSPRSSELAPIARHTTPHIGSPEEGRGAGQVKGSDGVASRDDGVASRDDGVASRDEGKCHPRAPSGVPPLLCKHAARCGYPSLRNAVFCSLTDPAGRYGALAATLILLRESRMT